MFVRIRLPIGQPHPGVLVIDRAVLSDQGMKYVYVVDQSNTAQYRRVTTGPLQEDGLRVIATGLKPEELVVVGGLQQVSAGSDRPRAGSMPSLDQPAEEYGGGGTRRRQGRTGHKMTIGGRPRFGARA